jgi:hypothetical protein
MYQGSFFSTFSPTFVVCVLDGSHSNKSEMEYKPGFDLHFLLARDVDYFFMCFLAIWTPSFEKALFSSLAHFFFGSLIF